MLFRVFTFAVLFFFSTMPGAIHRAHAAPRLTVVVDIDGPLVFASFVKEASLPEGTTFYVDDTLFYRRPRAGGFLAALSTRGNRVCLYTANTLEEVRPKLQNIKVPQKPGSNLDLTAWDLVQRGMIELYHRSSIVLAEKDLAWGIKGSLPYESQAQSETHTGPYKKHLARIPGVDIEYTVHVDDQLDTAFRGELLNYIPVSSSLGSKALKSDRELEAVLGLIATIEAESQSTGKTGRQLLQEKIWTLDKRQEPMIKGGSIETPIHVQLGTELLDQAQEIDWPKILKTNPIKSELNLQLPSYAPAKASRIGSKLSLENLEDRVHMGTPQGQWPDYLTTKKMIEWDREIYGPGSLEGLAFLPILQRNSKSGDPHWYHRLFSYMEAGLTGDAFPLLAESLEDPNEKEIFLKLINAQNDMARWLENLQLSSLPPEFSWRDFDHVIRATVDPGNHSTEEGLMVREGLKKDTVDIMVSNVRGRIARAVNRIYLELSKTDSGNTNWVGKDLVAQFEPLADRLRWQNREALNINSLRSFGGEPPSASRVNLEEYLSRASTQVSSSESGIRHFHLSADSPMLEVFYEAKSGRLEVEAVLYKQPDRSKSFEPTKLGLPDIRSLGEIAQLPGVAGENGKVAMLTYLQGTSKAPEVLGYTLFDSAELAQKALGSWQPPSIEPEVVSSLSNSTENGEPFECLSRFKNVVTTFQANKPWLRFRNWVKSWFK